MATYSREDIDPKTPGQTVWKRIRDQLSLAESVEIVKYQDQQGNWRFQLRTWTGARADDSNSSLAVPGDDY